MAQYEIKFKIWGEYPSSYEGVCKVELSDNEVQQFVGLMQEYNTSDIEELDLEENLPRIYEKICNSCDEIAAIEIPNEIYANIDFCMLLSLS